MKILRIVTRLNVGGPARHVIWLTEGLRTAGCDTLLVAGAVPPGEDDMSYVAAAAGITPITLPEMSREISLKDTLVTWKLFRLMLRERPDIVHTHTAKAGAVGRIAGLMYRWLTPGALVGRPRRCRFVHTYHGHVFHSYYGPLRTRLFLTIEKLLARLATDRIVVVSEQQRREINEVFRVGRHEQFAVVPLGIDTNVYADWRDHRPRARAELNATENDVLIGIIGRLTTIKNHNLFLEAASLLKEIIGNKASAEDKANLCRVRFVIVGDGDRRGNLEAHAASLGLSEDILFLGTRNDPENFYAALDIVALTSLNEGTPLTLIEAMANARPVIATAVGGVAEVLGPTVVENEEKARYARCERGILVRSGDAEGLARGLHRLVNDDGLRQELGRKGLEFVVRNYRKERLLANIKDLYAQLVAGDLSVTERAEARGNRPTAAEGTVVSDKSSRSDYRARLAP